MPNWARSPWPASGSQAAVFGWLARSYTMRPNFFFIFPPGSLDGFAATWITSFHLPPERKMVLNGLLKQFPTVTILEVDDLIDQVHTIIGQVTLAIEVVLSLVLMPVLASLLLPRRIRESEPWLVRAARRGYAPVLDLALRRAGMVLGVAGGIARCRIDFQAQAHAFVQFQQM